MIFVVLDVAVPEAATVATAAAEPAHDGALAAPREPTASPGASVQASPAARKLANEMGVDLAQVQGTGPQGRITPEDVHLHAARLPAAVSAIAPLWNTFRCAA